MEGAQFDQSSEDHCWACQPAQIYVKSIICLISKFKEEFKSWNENLPKFWQLGEILHISFLYFIFDFLYL